MKTLHKHDALSLKDWLKIFVIKRTKRNGMPNVQIKQVKIGE